MFESTQSVVAAVFLVLILLIELALFVMSNGLMGLAAWGLYLVVGIPLSILMVYTVNCLVIGSCKIWSWFQVIFIILEFIALLIILIMTTVLTSKNSAASNNAAASSAALQSNQLNTNLPILPLIPAPGDQ